MIKPMRLYVVGGSRRWYHEGRQPEGAVLADDIKKKNTSRKSSNKSRQTSTKKKGEVSDETN